MHKNTTKYNKTQSKWCINKHGASKIIDTFETYQPSIEEEEGAHDENHSELIKQTECMSTQLCKSPEWFGNPVLSIMLVDHDEPVT
jgi:hypothetical protein